MPELVQILLIYLDQEAGMGRQRKPQRASAFSAPRCWQLFHHADTESEGREYLLYSDSALLGRKEASVGPITIFLTGAGDGGRLTGQLILRFVHASPKAEPTDLEFPEHALKQRDWWLGLGPDEEVAALLSLALGIRVRSGGSIRRFLSGGDPAGEPHMFEHHTPGLVPVPERRLQLPGLPGGPCKITPGLERLEHYSRLQPTDAFVLAKAARQFADALWIADSDPDQAWLRLVNALEVVAVHVQTQAIDAEQVFQDAYPRAAERIKMLEGGGEALPEIAREFERLLRAGQRVRDFAERYRPDPPSIRPEASRRVDWEQMDGMIKTIYGYRSRLVHEGLPFPPMMTDSLVDRDDHGVPAERPDNTAVYVQGGTAWGADHLPMYLWLFVHIVQGTLLNWWAERAS